MTDDTLKQEKLALTPPPTWEPTPVMIERTLNFDCVNGVLHFFYEKVQDDPYDLNIRIDANCTVRIYLDPRHNWRWSQKLEAVTTKFDCCMLYGDLRYKDSFGNYNPRSPGDTHEYMVIEFKARQNQYGEESGIPLTHHAAAAHGFSLNIDLKQPRDEQGNEVILPLTLDPDIQNPPPPHTVDEPYLRVF